MLIGVRLIKSCVAVCRVAVCCVSVGSLSCGAPSAAPIKTAAAEAEPTSSVDQCVGSEPFQLIWRDDFDHFDRKRWATATHSFETNAATFRPENVVIGGGRLRLLLSPSDDPEKPYWGGELRTQADFVYGKFETRVKFARAPGVIASFFTFHDRPGWQRKWQEIDIEYVGHPDKAKSVQLNLITHDDPTVEERKTAEVDAELDFRPADDFHVYAFEWEPGVVRFYIDGQLVLTNTEDAKILRDPQKLMMNLWVSEAPEWAGAMDGSTAPSESVYDWVKLYRYCPQ